MNNIIINCNGKRYRPCVSKHPCTRKSCDLYKPEICDVPDYTKMTLPCEKIWNILDKSGLRAWATTTFKEIK